MSEAEIDYRLLEAIVFDVKTELLRATRKFNSFKSAHEGYAIIVEELEEMWEEIKHKPRDYWKMREEAVQLCAMVLRFLPDLCKELGPV